MNNFKFTVLVIVSCFSLINLAMEVDEEETPSMGIGVNLTPEDYEIGYRMCGRLILSGKKCNGFKLYKEKYPLPNPEKKFGRASANKIFTSFKQFLESGDPNHLIYVRTRTVESKFDEFKPENVENTLNWLENLSPDKGMVDAANIIGCSVRRLQQFTSQHEGTWKLPPKIDSGFKDRHKAERIHWIDRWYPSQPPDGIRILNPDITNAIFIDDKIVTLEKKNRSQFKQYRRRGSTKPLVPLKFDRYKKSKVIGTFFTNVQSGNEVFIHGIEHVYTSPRAHHFGKTDWWSENVGCTQTLSALESKLVWMKTTGAKYIITDAGHDVLKCGIVLDWVRGNGFDIIERAHMDNEWGGTPAYSPEFSPLDGYMFGPFQSEISKVVGNILDQDPNWNVLPNVLLKQAVEEIWKSNSYVVMGQKAVRKLPEVYDEVWRRGGERVWTLPKITIENEMRL